MQAFQTFLSDFGLVVALVFLVGGLLLAWKVKPSNFKEYFKSKDGKGALRGMIVAPGVILLAGLAIFTLSLLPVKAHAEGLKLDNQYGHFFNEAYTFMGIDRTKNISPMCSSGGYDDRSTSNMGFGLNVWESNSRNVRFDMQYTHHSCAINPDTRGYDAYGVKLTWTPWRR